MSDLRIKAEVLAGTRLEEAIAEAIRLAQRISVPIEIRFNGVDLCLFPGSLVADKVREYENGISRPARKEKKEGQK